ncbi:type II toxin-antitoxin system RelE/ParE family toxin [Pseudomonas sp. LA21]|uniref:type II toxin-antitoxin system RelE/ParE family toxin n=1 Tax=unclassified Pseudomonas TaxID=196821 RepID=UPI001FB6FABF|nr:type II toxin-antitoxin system RelE/ParE family toxin [Pseudomonas sp. LA21]MCJ1885070.1 type II toxin-antitoxin system RelE/ParE family toxin [Pseudomonas sp. LA21]
MTYLIKQTDIFGRWLAELRDVQGKVALLRRLERIRSGNLGDVRSVGVGVSELRLDIGPGYRVYFTRRGNVVIVLLCGGDKSSQQRDIKLAQQLAGEIE